MPRYQDVTIEQIRRALPQEVPAERQVRAGHRFDTRDVRSRIPGEQIDRVLAGVQDLKSQAATEGWTLLGMALQFQLAHPGCSTITVGMKTRQQVEENVAAVGERHAYDFERIIATLEGAVHA